MAAISSTYLIHSHFSKRPDVLHRRGIKLISNSSSSPINYSKKPKRDLIREWVTRNDEFARSLPIYVGGFSLLTVLANRAFSGIAPVADASSSQSRADILTLGLAVTNILSGLVWISIRPKYISPVAPQGMECKYINSAVPKDVASELLWSSNLGQIVQRCLDQLCLKLGMIQCIVLDFRRKKNLLNLEYPILFTWAWESLSNASCCRSLVIVYGGSLLLQIGVAAESSINNDVAIDVPKLMHGSLYKNAMKSGKQSYLANLSLYPGKVELPFLPMNTQAAILQPLSDKGIAIVGGDTIRGFNNLDQAWITSISEKLDATLSKLSENS